MQSDIRKVPQFFVTVIIAYNVHTIR